MKVRWEIEDGYVGKARPQKVRLHEPLTFFETEDELIEYLYEVVEEDFRNRITWYIQNEDEVIEEWRKARESERHADSRD